MKGRYEMDDPECDAMWRTFAADEARVQAPGRLGPAVMAAWDAEHAQPLGVRPMGRRRLPIAVLLAVAALVLAVGLALRYGVRTEGERAVGREVVSEVGSEGASEGGRAAAAIGEVTKPAVPARAAVEPFEAARPVLNAPYTADAVTEVTQVLPDGNRIERRTTSEVARDSRGRIRREHQGMMLGALQATPIQVPLVSITDPTSGTHVTLNQERRVAHRLKMPAFGMPTEMPVPGPGDVVVSVGARLGGPGPGRLLLDPSADRQTARHALGNRTVERGVIQRAEKRDQIFLVVIHAPETAQQRIELFAADIHVPVAPAAPRTAVAPPRLESTSS